MKQENAQSEIERNPIFWPTVGVMLLIWGVLFRLAPNLIPAFTFAGIAVIWAIYRIPFAMSEETLGSFFLYERKMPRKEFVGTFVTTNIGLFSSISFSTILIAQYGIGPAVLSVVAWLAGIIWFSQYIERLVPFLKRGTTLHEFIASSYATTDLQRQQLRLISSIITLVIYLASVGVEIKFASDLFSSVTNISSGLLAALLCVAGILYVSIAGYRGVVSTDRLRFVAVLFGVVFIFLFVASYMGKEPIVWPGSFFNLSSLTYGTGPGTLVSILILLTLFQFCVMDMWERCISIVNSKTLLREASKTENSDAVAAREIKKMLIWRSIPPFVILFFAWYSIGLLAVAQNWTNEPSQILAVLFKKVELYSVEHPLYGRLIESGLIVCFVSAALSTIDGFLIAAVQTVAFDWFRVGEKLNRSSDRLGFERRALLFVRLLTVLLGFLAVGVAFLKFDLMSFWQGMYALMLSFFPPILFALHPTLRSKYDITALRVGLSMIIGSSVTLALSIYGTFIVNSPNIVALGSVVGVAIPTIIILAGRKHIEGRRDQGSA